MKLLTLIAAVALTTSTVGYSRDVAPDASKHTTRQITGVLVMHWEYPYLITDESVKKRNIFEFKFGDTKWKRDIFDKIPMSPTSDIYYVCVSGSGYIDYADLGETGRPTFVFTNVSSTFMAVAQGDCHHGKLTG